MFSDIAVNVTAVDVESTSLLRASNKGRNVILGGNVMLYLLSDSKHIKARGFKCKFGDCHVMVFLFQRNQRY